VQCGSDSVGCTKNCAFVHKFLCSQEIQQLEVTLLRAGLSPFLQWKLNVFLYLALGWKTAKIYLFLLGKLYYHLNRKEKQRIEDAILQVTTYGNRETSQKDIIARVFDGILCHYYEKLFIVFEEPKEAGQFLRQNVDGEDLRVLREKLSEGNGVILVTGHYGAIEYMPVLLAINDIPTSMIAKFKSTLLRKKVYSQAKIYNIKMIDAADGANVMQSAIRDLRENRVLIIQCDEIDEWRPSARKIMPFLGRMTGVDRTINILQKRSGSEVVFGIIHRYNLNKYRLIMYPYEHMLRLPGSSWASSVGETVLRILEQHIYANPEQWYLWKKYTDIITFPSPSGTPEKFASPLVLKPALDRPA
jgi:KDO2-lipid IV(A) lauroyltransferase